MKARPDRSRGHSDCMEVTYSRIIFKPTAYHNLLKSLEVFWADSCFFIYNIKVY